MTPLTTTISDSWPARVRARLSGVDWSLDPETWIMLRLTTLAAVVAAALISIQGLTFPFGDAVQPLAICLALGGLAAFYRFMRPVPSFVLVLKALLFLVLYSTIYSVLMYAIGATGRPLADGLLARCDQALGVWAPNVVQFTSGRPWLAWGLKLAYFSLIPQTILAIVWLGLSNNRANLDGFLIRFMLGSLITAIGLFLWPALGTYGGAYHLQVPDYCQVCASHLEALRTGSQRVITWRGAEGIITFPSFHTIWAVLLAAAFHGCSPALFWSVAALNVAVVISTVPIGMHYVTDVTAGVLIALALIAVVDVPRRAEAR